MKKIRRPIAPFFRLSKTIGYQLKKLEALNEARHVFNGIIGGYRTKIKDACYEIIQNLKSGKVARYRFRNRMYTKVIIDNLLPSLKQCVIYVGINSYMEADNASAILINDNDFDEDKLFISTEQPLVISNSTGYEKLCILLECGRNVVTSGDIKTIEKVLVHELMHVYNDVKHSVMSIHTGAAYYFADLLCNAVLEQEYGIPTPEDIIGNKVSDIEMYAALMYYCDPSELNAFKQAYQVEAVYTVSYRRFRLHNVPEKSEMLKLFKTETYRVYESLYKFLIMHMEFCSNIISNQNIRSILLQYYKETDIKHPKLLPMFWKSRILKQLNDCKTIFHDICEEEY